MTRLSLVDPTSKCLAAHSAQGATAFAQLEVVAARRSVSGAGGGRCPAASRRRRPVTRSGCQAGPGGGPRPLFGMEDRRPRPDHTPAGSDPPLSRCASFGACSTSDHAAGAPSFASLACFAPRDLLGHRHLAQPSPSSWGYRRPSKGSSSAAADGKCEASGRSERRGQSAPSTWISGFPEATSTGRSRFRRSASRPWPQPTGRGSDQ